LSIFEIHGYEAKLYCQSLSLLGKLFIEDKALFYCIDRFIFYIAVKSNSKGLHLLGYFSRELDETLNSNILSCIAVLPPFQRKGIGRILISLSYEIAKRMGRIGGPERPLSQLGRQAFISYWKDTLITILSTYGNRIQSYDDLMKLTSIARSDITIVLRELEIKIRYTGIKKQTVEFDLERVNRVYVERKASMAKRKPFFPELLIWLPSERPPEAEVFV
jgi:histone acetyltransferase MYST1